MGQKVSTKSCIEALSLSPLHEYWYYLVLSCNICVKGGKIKRKNKLIRLPWDNWCSLLLANATDHEILNVEKK